MKLKYSFLIAVVMSALVYSGIYAQGGCRQSDSLALVALYNATNGPQWVFPSSVTYNDLDGNGNQAVPNAGNRWLVGPISRWHGVRTNAQGCVVELILWWGNYNDGSGVGVTGAIPESIGNLSNLRKLEIPHNNVSGNIPPSLGNLTNLERLLFQFNDYEQVTLPASIGNLSTLKHLAYHFNKISGPIPASFGNLRSLEIFHFKGNRLSGALPESLCNLTRVNNMDISDNLLSGDVPECFSNVGRSSVNGGIVALWMQNNDFQYLPDMSALRQVNPNIFEVNDNGFTFDDILPSLNKFSVYAPQDSFYTDTVITVFQGTDLVIDLGIDESIFSNRYQWYYNGNIFGNSITGDNSLTLANIQPSDAGDYWCRVTNPNASRLTLYSRRIRVIVEKEPLTVECPFGEEPIVYFVGEENCSIGDFVPQPNISGGCPDYVITVDIIQDEEIIKSGAGDVSLEDIAPGTYTVRYTVTDQCDQTGMVECTLRIVDTVAPVPMCAENLTVILGDFAPTFLTAEELDNGSFDNCGIDSILIRRRTEFDENCNPISSDFTMWSDRVFFDCCDAGQLVEVGLRIVDIKGNVSTCTTFVEVIDPGNLCKETEPLVVACPVLEDGDGQDEVMTYFAGPEDCTILENLPQPEISGGCPEFEVFTEIIEAEDVIKAGAEDVSLEDIAPGTYTVRYTVTDQCDQTGMVECTLRIVDTIAPVAICAENLTVSLGDFAPTFLTAEELDNGSFDNCGIDSILIRRRTEFDENCNPISSDFTMWSDRVFFDCCDAGQLVEVGLRIVDIKGNVSTCTTFVEVIDPGNLCKETEPLVVACPVLEDGDGQDEVMTYFAGPEDCTILENLPQPEISGGCPEFEVFTEIIEAEDVIKAGAEDVSLEDIAPGTYTVRYAVTDQCDQTGMVECTLRIVDTVAPVPMCAENLTVILGDFAPTFLTAEELDNGSFDNCGIDSILIRRRTEFDENCNPISSDFTMWSDRVFFDCCDAGQLVEVGLRIVDIKGNVSTCTTFVEVIDPGNLCKETEPLVVACPLVEDGDGQDEVMTYFAGPEDCTILENLPQPEISGGCPEFAIFIEIIEAEDVIKSGAGDVSLEDIAPGTYTVRYTVTDQCEQTGMVECTLRIVDTVAPVPMCAENLTVILGDFAPTFLTAEELDNGSFDNCGIDSILIRRRVDRNGTCLPISPTFTEWSDQVQFDCCDGGKQVLVELRIVDQSGNEAICSTEVTVEGNSCEAMSCRTLDSLILMDLYTNNGGDQWLFPSGVTFNDLEAGAQLVPNAGNAWLSGPITQWHGVRTNEEGCVIGLILWSGEYNNGQGIGVTGELPESLGGLSELRRLEMPHNAISGSIPESLGNLASLERLLLQNNGLEGTIPESLGDLSELKHLGLHFNDLSGPLPDALGNLINMEIFHFKGNQLSGELPATLCNLEKVFNFDVSDNQLSGSISDCFVTLGNQSRNGGIQALWLQNNRLDSLPDLSAITQQNPGIFEVQNNRLTFDDILPNIEQLSVYAPQDSIFRDTLIQANAGDLIAVDLGIDEEVETNIYQWFKDGVPFGDPIEGFNELVFENIQLEDEGDYNCRVTNPLAPDLELLSRTITILVQEIVPCSGINAEIDAYAYCEGEPIPVIEVQAEEGIDINWYDAPEAGNLLAAAQFSFQPETPGVYFAEAVQDGVTCNEERLAITVSEIVIQSPESLGDVTFCEGDSIPSLEVTVGEGEAVDWYSDATEGELLLEGSTVFQPENPGTYFASARHLELGCESPERTPVELLFSEGIFLEAVNDEFTIEDLSTETLLNILGNDDLQGEEDLQINILLEPSQGTLSVSGLEVFYQPNAVLDSLKDEFVYEVCTESCGGNCAVAVVQLILEKDCAEQAESLIPNSFTPNDDGINDEFDPLSAFFEVDCLVDIETIVFTVVNRWGEVVFKPESYQAWNGRATNGAGEVLPQGAYYFVLSTGNGDVLAKSAITLLK